MALHAGEVREAFLHDGLGHHDPVGVVVLGGGAGRAVRRDQADQLVLEAVLHLQQRWPRRPALARRAAGCRGISA
jgi:hypothetical protein